jgi:hypothetical protein
MIEEGIAAGGKLGTAVVAVEGIAVGAGTTTGVDMVAGVVEDIFAAVVIAALGVAQSLSPS